MGLDIGLISCVIWYSGFLLWFGLVFVPTGLAFDEFNG